MTRPVLLDAYCCIGGASMGYYRAGFDVVGVDKIPQPDYPFEMHVGDAVDFIRAHGDEFDAIAASPPCQASAGPTTGTNAARNADIGREHPQLIPATRDALNASGRPWVMENVVGSELRRDLTLCGLMFGLPIFRHRYFELGRWLALAIPHPSHHGHRVRGWRHGVDHPGDILAIYGDGGGKATTDECREGLGIDWSTDRERLVEAIPPSYTEFIGEQLVTFLASEVAA